MDFSVRRLDEVTKEELDAWDELFAAQEGLANPFCAPEWPLAWCSAWSRPDLCMVVLIRDGTRLVGVAPLHRQTYAVRGRTIATRMMLAGAGPGGRNLELPQVLTWPGHARPVLRALIAELLTGELSHLCDWAELSIPIADGWFESEWAYDTGHEHAFFHHLATRPSCVVSFADTWEATRSRMGRNIKESMRRSRNRLAKSRYEVAVVEFGAHGQTLDVAAVDRFLDLHLRRAEHAAGVRHIDNFSHPSEQASMRALLPQLGERGRASLLELRLDGATVAAQLLLHAPRTIYVHSSGLLGEHWELGPVTHLQAEALQLAHARGDRWANFSPGVNVSKMRWGAAVVPANDFAFGAGTRRDVWRFELYVGMKARAAVRGSMYLTGRNNAPAKA
ncbi:MAG: GNAT family N-acetyltransferase [Actinobacteria bacterium]|nr:GNAT family N-acetyltransferase [Actinomycetota bacterium]